ncbi:Dolichyl-diphosphooligosaccharide--protein glycosyltransferase subunitB [Sesamum angolense]|uniref:Dolichyl-diphosphooligosaccharide--protein glycosyltransferase subunit 1 n=1 Tax=Sesamum angolense TaxID=2727404 RepID=A0AAE1X3A4_9LAMI|nr:Dolichyl-diphosphooligosaccharide--protein glycosyltransferase subunitB [Sesamum angolense]
MAAINFISLGIIALVAHRNFVVVASWPPDPPGRAPKKCNLTPLQLNSVQIDLTSHIVRVCLTLKVENIEDDPASTVLLAFPPAQFDRLALVKAVVTVGKKRKKSYVPLEVNPTEQPSSPNGTKYYAISLLKPLLKGETTTLELVYILTHSLEPFPVEISQADSQLVYYHDSAIILSPYHIKQQATVVKTPSNKVTEHYKLAHAGAKHKGVFSRVEYQSRPAASGVSSFKHLLAELPPRVHSVYYRDDIGNISSSRLRTSSKKSELLIEPRYPLFGGWKATFVIGYGVPLQDFLFKSAAGARYLNYSFGCPLVDTVVDKLTIKVVLPEGSQNPSVEVPFAVEQSLETKYSYLDVIGRTVVVLEKKNVVLEHNVPFQCIDFGLFSASVYLLSEAARISRQPNIDDNLKSRDSDDF